MELWALIVAAGRGTRMGSGPSKVMCLINGKPLLEYTLRPFASAEKIRGICVVTTPDMETQVADLLAQTGKESLVVRGGAERSLSVLCGLKSLPDSCDMVLVHDGARPCLKDAELERVIDCLEEKGSAVAGYYAQNTIHTVDREGKILSTPDRRDLFEAQTPQGFPKAVLIEAYEKAAETGTVCTDEAAAAAVLGIRAAVVPVSRHNMKLTYPEDRTVLTALLTGERQPLIRVGTGYDAHRLKKGRRLILGGVEICHETGLDGHSDADVLAHAIMDGILGAAGKGDIGQLFPSEDPMYQDADSMELLRTVVMAIRSDGWEIANVDSTVIAQRPKLQPYREQMIQNLAAAMNLPVQAVSVKATTTERMGFEGREEGISATAVILLMK